MTFKKRFRNLRCFYVLFFKHFTMHLPLQYQPTLLQRLSLSIACFITFASACFFSEVISLRWRLLHKKCIFVSRKNLRLWWASKECIMRQLYEYAKKDLQTSNSLFHGFIPTGTVNSDTKVGNKVYRESGTCLWNNGSFHSS